MVAGGWTPRQFAEDRLPTQGEIAAAAPDHRVYVQLLYSRVLLSPGGVEALGIPADAGLMQHIKIEDGPDGEPTGWLLGDARTISELFDRLPRPSMAQQAAGNARVLPLAQCARADRGDGPRRLQHAARRLSGAVPGLARAGIDGSRALQSLRAAPRP